jgi:hypothetical protein
MWIVYFNLLLYIKFIYVIIYTVNATSVDGKALPFPYTIRNPPTPPASPDE